MKYTPELELVVVEKEKTNDQRLRELEKELIEKINVLIKTRKAS